MKKQSLHSLKVLAISLSLMLPIEVMAVTCLDVFPTVLSSSSSDAKAKFEENVSIFGTDGTIAISIDKDKTSDSDPSCISQKCKDSGMRAEAFSLPKFPNFEGFSSESDKKADNGKSLEISQGSYRKVEAGEEASIHFKHKSEDTYIGELKVDKKVKLTFDAGVYWIKKFDIEDDINIVINGNVRLMIDEYKGNKKKGGLYNSGGSPEQLVIVAYGDLKFGEKTTLNGFVYSDNKVELDDESTFKGAIHSDDDITFKEDSSINKEDTPINYVSSIIESANFNGLCTIEAPSLTPLLDYRFDECSLNGVSGDIVDQTGNFNGGSHGVPAPIDNGVINKSLDLSATDASDWISVPNGALDGIDDFSIAVWFKTSVDKSQQEILHALGSKKSDDELEIFLKNSDVVYVKVRDRSEELSSSIKLTDGEWHHMVVTRVDKDVCLFIDGEPQECKNGVKSGTLSVTKTDAIVIGQEQIDFGGRFSEAQSFVGQLDEFKIFDKKIADIQIYNMHQSELAGKNYDASTRDVVQCDNICYANAGELNTVGLKIGNGGKDTQINDTTEALAIYTAWQSAGSPDSGEIANGTYNVLASGLSAVDRIDFGGSGNNFSGTLPYPGADTGVKGNDFLVHTSGTISLPAGDYTIYVESDDGFNFVMNTVSGDAVSFKKFGNSTVGNSNELRYEETTANTDTGGSFTLSQDSVFDVAAIFFERGGQDFLEISIANEIRNNSAPDGYEILRHGALGGKVRFGQCSPPAPEIDHYEIVHDGQGLTCDSEVVIVRACTDASCSALSDQPVTLDFLVDGALISSPTFTGSTSINVNNSVAKTVTFSLASTSITAANPFQCDDSAGSSCDMAFTDAGFRFLSGAGNTTILPNQTAGAIFGDTLKLQAVQNENGVCTGLFTGNHDIDLSQENVEPGGTSGLSFTVDGAAIAKQAGVTSTTLNFGAQSIAIIPSPIYNDAGQIRLRASYNQVGAALVTGSSNPFWVKPAELSVSATSGGTALNAANANAAPTHAAGGNFDLTVRALNSQGVVTPNYSPGQIQLLLTRTGPTLTGSVDGNLRYEASSSLASSTSPVFRDVTLTAFSSGVSTYNAAQYSEVGVLKLDAQDNNYGNAGMLVSATEINIGRFIPAYFTQTVVEDGVFAATCNSNTTFAAYSGQMDEATNSIGAISYLTNPVFAITAHNTQGSITQNYFEDSQGSVNDYMKLSAADINLTVPTADQSALGVDSNKLPLTANMSTGILSQTNLTAASSGAVLPRGILHYQLSDADNFVYNRSANALVSPFRSDIDFSIATIIDADNVSATSTVAASPTGVEIRFGRLLLSNSFGPETSNFPQQMQIEHFDGNNFVATSDENCASYDAGRISLTNISLNPSHTSVLGGTGSFINGRVQAIQLQSPGAGNQGDIGVLYDAYDWFKYDWDNDGAHDDNPEAIATFGIYRGNDRTIYWREVLND